MPTGVQRLAFWAMLTVMLAATLASVGTVQAANSPTYNLRVYVYNANAVPVPSGVTVDLMSGATHEVYTATTGSNGLAVFTGGSNGNPGSALVPGSWGLWVPPAGNVSLGGLIHQSAVLPANAQPTFSYYTAQNLSSRTFSTAINGVSIEQYSAVIDGIATQAGTPAIGANVELIDPTYNGLVLNNTTTRSIGNYSMQVPYGNWTLETIQPDVPTAAYAFQNVSLTTPKTNVSITVGKYLAYGTVYQKAAPSSPVPFGGNATVFDTTNGAIYSYPTSDGGFYAIGTYPAGYTGPGSETFDVILSTIGYKTVWYPLTVSSSSPSGGPNPHNVEAAAQYTPAYYNTTLSYSKGFKWLNTTTSAFLSNDSVFPELDNASVGQLWAQLALDWQHNLSFSAANWATVQSWIESAGPFFPAGSAQATVNASGYNESAGGLFAASSTCAAGTFCGLNSSAAIRYSWTKNYSLNSTDLNTNASSYQVTFNFRHPTNYQAINYTIDLPKGYTLQAGTPAPAGSRLVADGPGGTWTSFTLVSLPYASPSGTASLTFVKYGNVTANVNASISNFAFSKLNVLNSTHDNYTVVVGTGQNVTFDAAGSTFPAGINGTLYQWIWGDGNNSTTTGPLSYHTYARAGNFSGSLNLTSSGGTSATVTFRVYAAQGTPTGAITSNASSWETRKTPGGNTYLWVNWSTSLQFNASGVTVDLGSGEPAGFLSVASWNATFGPKNQTQNLTASSGVYVPGNFTVTFSSTGDNQYLRSTTLYGDSIPLDGWQYNLTLWAWSGTGQGAKFVLYVLVHDTQKPTSVATLQNSAGTNVTSAGIVEGANHTAQVRLVSSYSFDPNGGSLTWYNWTIRNPGNSSVNGSAYNISQPARSGLRAPLYYTLWLDPQTKPYNVNLTVTDLAGNTNYDQVSLTIAVNTSTRPVLAVGNMTAPSSMTDGTSYTIWVNVTNTLGANSTARNVTVQFYLLPPSGSGTPIYLGGTVSWYAYDNGTVYSNVSSTGTLSALKYNVTMRAQISWTPSRTGTWELWANATASNEFPGDYSTGSNQASVSITLNANPIVEDYEIAAVVGAIAVIIVLALLVTRWRSNRGSKGGGRSSGKAAARAKDKEKTDKPAADDDDEND